MSASEPSSPAAWSWTRTFPSAAASTGPARTGPSRDVRRQPAEKIVPGTAADHVHDLDRRAGDQLDLLEHESVLAGKALEDRADQHGALVGAELAALLAGGAYPGGHVPGSHQLGDVWVEQRAARTAPCRASSTRAS